MRLTAAVAVCIPVQDRIESFRLALASVYMQTVLPREIIIVDDRSQNPVTTHCLPKAPHGVHLTIIRNAVNLGSGASRNLAAQASRQPLIAFLDSDDLFLPTYIEDICAFWAKNPSSYSALATGYFWCDDLMIPYRLHQARPETRSADLLTRGNVVGGCSVISVQRAVFDTVGGFSMRRGVDDWDLLIRLAAIAPIATLSKALVLYRAPALSSMPSMTSHNGRQILALIALLKNLSIGDRSLARSRICLLVAHHLAFSGRKKPALRQLLSSIKARGGLERLHVQVGVTAVIGPVIARRILAQLAKWRAARFRRFLAHHGLRAGLYVAQLRSVADMTA
jgi:glycosyltransferase involved in cell wall biosynthesis